MHASLDPHQSTQFLTLIDLICKMKCRSILSIYRHISRDLYDHLSKRKQVKPIHRPLELCTGEVNLQAMAASVQLGISSKQILLLSLLLLLLLLSSSPLRSVTAADTSSPETCELAQIPSLHPRKFVLDMLFYILF
jgi:hypothetical protein